MATIDESSVAATLYTNCSLIAVKCDDKLFIIRDKICGLEGETVSIYKLFSDVRKLAHETDLDKYDYIFDIERIARIITSKDSCIDPEFQLKVPGSDSYEPYQFAVVRDESNTVIVIKRTDRFYNLLENAMGFFSYIMEKILIVNVTNDTYKEIRIRDNLDHPSKLSNWIEKFAKYNVAEDDQQDLLDYFGKVVNGTMYNGYGDRPKAVVYRRCVNSAEYRWSILYAIPAKNYKDTNKEMYFYVIDIQDHYIIQAQRARRLGTDAYYDAETGLHNKRAFQNRIARLHGQKVGLAYVCLKDEVQPGYVDYESYRKSTVDMLVDEYGEDRCYRMSDKEFVVLSVGCHNLSAHISDDIYFGVAYANGPEDYGAMFDTAMEDAMK